MKGIIIIIVFDLAIFLRKLFVLKLTIFISMCN